MSLGETAIAARGGAAAGLALLVALGSALFFTHGCGPERRGRRPNILFILVDDQAPGTLGFEGNPVVRTPNIDRLAHQGTSFSRAYVPLPQCAPSRAAILTGRYPHQVGVLSNSDARLPPDLPTLAEVLGAAGYRRGMIGKWHLGDLHRPQGGFDDFWIELDRGPPEQDYFEPRLWVTSQLAPHAGYLPEILTDYAVRFIDQRDERPFLLYLAFKTPHVPFVDPPNPEHRVDPARIPLVPSAEDDLSSKPAPQRENASHEWFQQWGLDAIRDEAARYFAMIGALDRSIGRLLQHLESRGLLEDTLLVYMSDSGVLLGEHQMVGKGPAFYEELVRVPLIFHWPGVVPSGQRRSALVTSLDLFPTLAGLAGADLPSGLAGRNIWPLVLGQVDRVRDELFLEYAEHASVGALEPMLGVVTERHKYVRYLAKGDEELYDLDADPHEMENLAGSDRHADELARLRERVDRFERTIEDPFWR